MTLRAKNSLTGFAVPLARDGFEQSARAKRLEAKRACRNDESQYHPYKDDLREQALCAVNQFIMNGAR